VILNLVGNSIKFTERGEILMSVELEAESSGSALIHFAIKDTGVGIPADKVQKIFEPFSQADGSTSRKYGGTGLGLTICAKLVGMMEGHIWVVSEEGNGSTFHFTTTFGIQENAISLPPSMEAERLRNLSVLIVDDNSTTSRILQEIVTRFGMRPTAVGSGAAALEELQKGATLGSLPSLILVDSEMPGMNGFVLAERIQKDPALGSVEILMVTPAGQLGDAVRCREMGIRVYLAKPFHQAELLEAILQIINKTETPARSATNGPPLELDARDMSSEGEHRARVLLAEDNLINQTLAVHMLQKRGYHVTVTGDGRAAVQAFDTGQFHIVLMDIQMPGMDGFEATAAIRAKEKINGGHIPIIALTAHALKGDEEQCLSNGMDGYVSKPIKAVELVSVMEKLLDGKRSAQPNNSESVPDVAVTLPK
jgi:CheY-like chemotaxis protein